MNLITNILKPTNKKGAILLSVSFVCILGSYLIYNFISDGYTDCGSACSSWLSPIFPAGICMDVCVPQNIPHPLFAPLLQIGALLLIISVIYFVLSYFKSNPETLSK
ncbi:MAG: hypothetical protein WD335_01510 [Candidatus Paceibacterota bacterium]